MNIQEKREVRSCFSIDIFLDNPEVELKKAIAASVAIDQATKAMVSGEISPAEVLEWVEPHMEGISSMDDYIEEIEDDLSSLILLG